VKFYTVTFCTVFSASGNGEGPYITILLK